MNTNVRSWRFGCPARMPTCGSAEESVAQHACSGYPVVMQSKKRTWSLRLAILCVCLNAHVADARERIIGGPCEGCENVFVGLPADLNSSSRIAAADEPGEALIIEGTVRTPDGEPAAGIIVYAYQTDAKGIYPKGTTRHGNLRAWARTDEDGYYRFDTIRPAAYPGSSIPQHVHMHVIEPDRVTYYIDSVHFDDDPLLTPAERRRFRDRGGSGICEPSKDEDRAWRVRRDITLGKNIPGYP